MDVTTWFKKNHSDAQLVIGLTASRCRALLFQNSNYLGQVVVEVNLAEDAFEPLARLLQQYEIKRAIITIVLADDCYQQAEIEKPNVPDSEVSAALQWKLKDFISIEPANMVLDYYDLPSQKQIMAVAADKKWLTSWGHMVHQRLKGTLKHVLIEEHAILNFIDSKDAPILLLWQRPGKELRILLVYKQQLFLSRNLRGTANLENLATELLPSVIDNVSLEIQRALDYFESNLRQPSVRHIKLAVTESCRQLIQQQIINNLALEVESLEPELVRQLPDITDMSMMPLAAACMGNSHSSETQGEEQ